MSIFHKVPAGTNKGMGGNSAKQGTAVGSGSRPTKSVHPIESSAPTDPKFIRGNVKNPLS
jgi:hypothetical protein